MSVKNAAGLILNILLTHTIVKKNGTLQFAACHFVNFRLNFLRLSINLHLVYEHLHFSLQLANFVAGLSRFSWQLVQLAEPLCIPKKRDSSLALQTKLPNHCVFRLLPRHEKSLLFPLIFGYYSTTRLQCQVKLTLKSAPAPFLTQF